jgi:hypothetical protein
VWGKSKLQPRSGIRNFWRWPVKKTTFGNSALSQIKIKLWMVVISWTKNSYAGTNEPGASQIVDCCLGIEEVLLNGE